VGHILLAQPRRYSAETPMSSDQGPQTRCSIQESFPAALAGDVVAVMHATSVTEGHWPFAVVVQGQQLTLPYRIHGDAAALAGGEGLSPVQREIRACIFSRHFDGRVRERALREVVASSHQWVIPFVVQLVGEYVVEIHRVVQDALPMLDAAKYAAILRENAGFYQRTRQRVMSYWDCYYRAGPVYFDRRTYPAFQIIGQFDAWLRTSSVECLAGRTRP
jgi:hypothetical protein